MIILLLGLVLARAETYELPRQYIVASPMNDEFSDRMMYAPFTKLTPQPLQLTSPYFETLFSTLSTVQSRTSGSPTTSIRGSAQAGRVLYLLDNVPLNFLDGFGGSSLFVPTEILSQIHIFEGPSSASYGPNALGGSVHFVSMKRAAPLLRLGLSDTDTSFLPTEGGTVSDANIAAVVPLINTDSYHLQASAYFDKDRGDFPYTTASGERGRRRDNEQRLRRFTLIGHKKWERLQLSHVLLFTGLNKTTPGSLPIPGITAQTAEAALGAITAAYRLTDRLLWTSRLSYSSLHSDFEDSFGPSLSRSDKIWINQQLAWEFAPGYLSQTTLDYNKNFYEASFVGADQYQRIEPELAQTFVIPVTPHLVIEPTARYLAKYEKTLLQVNIPYSFESAKIWAMYAEGFRPPALIDLFAKTAFYLGNANLTPEESKQFEVGSSWTYQNYEVSASIFQVDYENLFQGTVNGLGVFSKRNAGEARSQGFSTKLNADFGRWKFHGSYSNLIARETSNQQPLLFSPEHQVFASATYQRSKWSLVWQQTLWSGFDDLDFTLGAPTRLAAWEGSDLLAFVKLSRKLSASFGIYNLFDRRRELGFGYPEPQRRTTLAFEYSF